MDLDPLGSRLDSKVQFAYWDLFSQTQVNPPSGLTYTFEGIADASSTLTGLSLVQSNAHIIAATSGDKAQGAGLLEGNDIYYSSTSAQSWLLNATASIDIAAMSFQIKTANVEPVIDQLFIPTLNGIGAGSYFISTETSDVLFNFSSYVIEYRWTDLDIAANTPLEIGFAMAGGSKGDFTRKPVDFVALDVSSVPEPSVAALCGVAALILPGLRRRRRP